MGVVSLLDFACLAEAAVTQVAKPEDLTTVQPPPADVKVDLDALIEVIDRNWANQVSAQDPRFAELIPAFGGDLTIFEQIDLFTSKQAEDMGEMSSLAVVLPDLKKRLRQISRWPLEKALLNFGESLMRMTDRRLKALLARLGWFGTPPVTLASAGEIADLTRERIRQLEKSVLQRIPDHPVYMPQLDAALDLIPQHAPLTLEAAGRLLKDAGIAANEFDPRSLLEAARACNRSPTFRLETIRGKTTVVTSPLVQRADAIISIASRQAEASGASNVEEVSAEAVSGGIETTSSEVRQILLSFSSVEFLGDVWFWRPNGKPGRNRLRNLTRKMLSVAGRLQLGTLREGLRREYRLRGTRGLGTWPLSVPPKSILAHLIERHPEFAIDGGIVRGVGELDYRAELRDTEQVLVEAFLASPGKVLDRASCFRACVERGLNENTLSLYLTYSPIVEHLGIDLWALRGVDVDPTMVEAVRQASAKRSRRRRVLDHGWTVEGRLWAAARLSTAIENLVFAIPGAIRSYVAGRNFPAFDESGNRFGNIAITQEGSSYGYGPYLRRRGADEGDVLVVEFDLVECKVSLEVGGEELLEAKAQGG